MSNKSPDSSSGSTANAALRAALEQQLRDPVAEEVTCRPPSVPDHTLLHRIGRGAYGDVWLARNALGTLRAVKIVYRARFKDDRPYEREFHGILKFEPISRTHEGLVQVLHVGRSDEAGCFYYVMELADGAGGVLSEADYSPRTLHSELARRRRLAPTDAAKLVLRLGGALAHLHAHGLVHRDIKPSNVIFVGGQPKLADIGLVTDVGSSHSFVGTEGFIPPEGPGTQQADLYGLGKLLYELATGRDRMDFPQLPPAVTRLPDGDSLLELNEVMTRACAPEPTQRYASATELQADVNLFLAGRSLRRARNIERTLARLKRLAAVACVLLVLAAATVWFVKNEERHANERARQATERARIEAESREKETALRRRAEEAERQTQQQLYAALREQARAMVRSGELGQRVQALDAIRRAAAISNSAELRREAFAALALPDLRFERELSFSPGVNSARLDPAFERLAVSRGKSPIEIRAVSDSRLLASLPASTNLPSFYREWSADGRFLAVKRDYPGGRHGDWEVWDVLREKRVLLLRNVSYQAFSFHPRLLRVIARTATEGVGIWNLEDGQENVRFPFAGRAIILSFSPDGERFAVVSPQGTGGRLSVHDATNPEATELMALVFKDEVNTMAWHPNGRSIVVPDHGGAVHWVDAKSAKTEVLGRHRFQAVRAVFTPDGDYLFTGGWERELVCWDAQTKRRVFTASLDSHVLQFSADGRRCAVHTATQFSVQLHAFLKSVAHRQFEEDLGARLRQATISPDGRWLAASSAKSAVVWDLSGAGPGAVATNAYDACFYFAPDGSELFGSRGNQGDTACFRWRLMPATNPATAPSLTRLPLRPPQGFTFLSLVSNSVVMTGSKGSQLLGRDEIEAHSKVADPIDDDGRWKSTIPGINGVSPDGRWLGIRRHNGSTLLVYRLPGLEQAATLTHPNGFGDFQFSPSGDEVAISSFRAGVLMTFWNTATWERTRTLTNFSRVLYRPDARALWLTKDQRTAGLYDARTLDPLLLLPAGMLPLALGPDGQRMAVTVDAQWLQVWDLAALRVQFRDLGLDWATDGQ